MADRWNRIFCPTLRALRQLRRFDVHVNTKGPGQVNMKALTLKFSMRTQGAARLTTQAICARGTIPVDRGLGRRPVGE